MPASSSLTLNSFPSSSWLSFNRTSVVCLPLIVALLVPLILWPFSGRRLAAAVLCYSCQGVCHNQARCNCQTGICEGLYCYSEIRYLASERYMVEKGCLRSASVDLVGCAYRRSRRHVHCICTGDDFCNETPSLSNGSKREQKLLVQCQECYSRKNCVGLCKADYCWSEVLTGAQQCGYGVPFLPYHYQTSTLLSLDSNRNACVKTEFNGQLQSFECVCSGSHCDEHWRTASRFQPLSSDRPLVTCYSCSHSSTVPLRRTVCLQNTCRGQFCFLNIENANVPSGMYVQTAGCLNSTMPSHVVLGCRHNWILDQRERVECVCTKDLCNSEPSTAHYSQPSTSIRARTVMSHITGCMTTILVFLFSERQHGDF